MVDLAGWAGGWDALAGLIAGRFARAEPRARVGAYLRGLLARLERKNGWTLAEHAGAISPDGMQRLLRTAEWDVDGVRDDLRGYVLGQLGAPDGVWVIDETGFVKKGIRSAGVQRQYTGTTGKIDNCQLGVFVAYASSAGRALVDRELYLPRSWTDEPDRWPPRSRARHGNGAAPGPVRTAPRYYDWATVALDPAGLPNNWAHWLLIRRKITTDDTPPELAFYRCAGPATTPTAEL